MGYFNLCMCVICLKSSRACRERGWFIKMKYTKAHKNNGVTLCARRRTACMRERRAAERDALSRPYSAESHSPALWPAATRYAPLRLTLRYACYLATPRCAPLRRAAPVASRNIPLRTATQRYALSRFLPLRSLPLSLSLSLTPSIPFLVPSGFAHPS